MKSHLVFLMIILVLANLIKTAPINDEKYALIFDAGSKNTRLYVFSYKFDAAGEVLVKQLEYCEPKDGGLANYVEESQVSVNFAGCMQIAGELVPNSKKSQTPIHMPATAGMRLLEIMNHTKSEIIQNYVRNFFERSGYLYVDPNQVRIISGQEEGVLAWLSANYLKKTLGLNKDSFGIIELGGSSGQIAFVPNEANLNPDAALTTYITDLNIYKKDYKVYSYSFLCFGTTQIANLYNAYRLRTENYAKKFQVSCYPDGAEEEVIGDELISLPCVNGQMYNSSYQFTIDSSLIKKTDVIRIQGNSKRNKCREEVDALLNKPICEYGDNQCSFDGVYLPPIDKSSRFLALGNFWENINNTGKLINANLENDFQAFDEATYRICQLTYKQLKDLEKANNADISNKKLRKLCLENVYIIKLLNAYGFESLANVDTAEIINDNKVNWVLGYLLNNVINNQRS